MTLRDSFRRLSISSLLRKHHENAEKQKEKEEKKKEKQEKRKSKIEEKKHEKEEKRKSKNVVPASHMDPDHPPGARDVGFRKSFAITGTAKNKGGGDSGRNSPTTMAKTAGNATLSAMNGKAGDNLQVPKGGRGKMMQTLDQYGNAYDSVSPRTHTDDPSTRKISEDLDLTAPPSAAAPVQANIGSADTQDTAAKEEGDNKEHDGTLEPMPTLVDSALNPNLPTTSNPTQTHILPAQDPDFLTTSKLSPRPHAPEKRNTHTSSIYSENPIDLSQVTTNRSDANIPLNRVTTNESNYTQDDRNAPNDPQEGKKPRPTTLQQEYTTLVDLPLTPLPTNTQFDQSVSKDEATKPSAEEYKDESDDVTPKAEQSAFPLMNSVDTEQPEDNTTGASKPGDFVAAIQNTFPDSAPNTAPVPVSPKDFLSVTPPRTTPPADAQQNAEERSNEPELNAAEKSAEDSFIKLTQTPPIESNDNLPHVHDKESGIAPKAAIEKLKLEDQIPVQVPESVSAEVPRSAIQQQPRPGLIERDTEDLIRSTPGGFVQTPVAEIVPDVVAH